MAVMLRLALVTMCAFPSSVWAGRGAAPIRTPPIPGGVGRWRRLPKPVLSREWADLHFERRRGRFLLRSARFGRYKRPTRSRRFDGPFQVRLYDGRKLVDLIAFAFPLTRAAGERSTQGIALNRALRRGVSVRTTVRIPIIARLTHVVILDTRSAQRERWTLVRLRRLAGPAANASHNVKKNRLNRRDQGHAK